MARYDKDISETKLHGKDSPVIVTTKGIKTFITPAIGDFVDHEGVGEVVKIGTGTLTAGDLYFLHTDGQWYNTDADNPSYGGTELLGVPLGTSPTTDGVLVKGIVRIDSANVQGTPAVGAAIYVSESHTAQFDFTAPTGSGDFVRIIGYCLATDSPSGDILMLFDPGRDHVELPSGGGAVSAVTNGADNRVATFTSSDALNGEANLTFDGTDLGVSAKIFHIGDTDTYIKFTDDDINIQAGGVNFVDFTEDTQNDVTFNEGGVDIDFRVESANNTHMLFVDGGNDRVGIGATPSCELHVSGVDPRIRADSTPGNHPGFELSEYGTRKWVIYNDPDEGHNIIFKSDRDLMQVTQTGDLYLQSSGSAGISVDKNYSDTDGATIAGMDIDFDKTGASTTTNTMYGIKVDMDNTTATNGNNYMYGLYVTPTLTHAADAGGTFTYGALINAQGSSNGSSFVQGARIEASGGDVNYGIQLDVEDGGVDLRIESSADSGDYFQIQTTTHGATTISTVDDDATAAHLSIDVDGGLDISAATGDINFQVAGVNQLSLDMDSTANQVDMQLKVNGDSLAFKQYDGYEVARVHDNSGIGGFGYRKLITDVAGALDLSSVATAIPYSGAVFSVAMDASAAYAITLPTATTAVEGKKLTGWHVSIIITEAAAEPVTVIRGDTSNDVLGGIVVAGDAASSGITIGSNVITFVGDTAVFGDRVDITCVAASPSNTFYVCQAMCSV